MATGNNTSNPGSKPVDYDKIAADGKNPDGTWKTQGTTQRSNTTSDPKFYDKIAANGKNQDGTWKTPGMAGNAGAAPGAEGVFEQSKKGVLFTEKLKAERGAYNAAQQSHEQAAKAVENAGAGATDALKEAATKAQEHMGQTQQAFNEAKDAAFKTLGKGDKIKAMLGGNFGEAGGHAALRVARGGAAVGAMIYTGKKTIDIFSPELDENGQRKESMTKTILKAGAGLLATLGLALAGGKARAMSR